MQKLKPEISYEDFAKVDIRVGTIVRAEDIPDSVKLFKLTVDFGELGQRQVLSGIKKWYSPADLEGQQTFFVVNMAPREMMGLTSEGMILGADGPDGKPVLLQPQAPLENGASVL